MYKLDLEKAEEAEIKLLTSIVPWVGDGQRGLAWYSRWGHKELDTTERLNWTELIVP